MNILLLSVGTRNKIVQYFKKELDGEGLVIATDASNLASALYDADKYYIVPRVGDKDYLNEIKLICKENNIKGVLSLIDPELTVIAENADDFRKIGTIPIISSYETIELCLDKMKTSQRLKKIGLNYIKTYEVLNNVVHNIKLSNINFPLFVKPKYGSASTNINIVNSVEELSVLFSKNDNLIVQEYMNEKEFGVDVYIDIFTGEVNAMFIKEKIKMKSGETEKSISVINKNISEIVNLFLENVPFRGVIDIDIFSKQGKYYISEVNPRFGGGYPHAYECGINIPKMIINNISGVKNTNNLDYKDNIIMLKYYEMKILENL